MIRRVSAAAAAQHEVVAAAYGTRLPRFQTYLVAFLITGLPRFVLFAAGAPLWMILAMCVIGGASSGFLNPVLGAVTFERDTRVEPATLIRYVQQHARTHRLEGGTKLRFTLKLEKDEQRFAAVEQLLAALQKPAAATLRK